MLIFHQLKVLLWLKQCTARSDYPSILSILILPSILLILSSSGGVSTTNENTLVECTAKSFLYCNYPMGISFDQSFYPLETNAAVATLKVAASNVAESFGSDYDTLFPSEVEFPFKYGGSVDVKNDTDSTVTWYIGKSKSFPITFLDRLNTELESLGGSIRFEEGTNEYEYEDPNVWDLKIASFFLLFQTSAQSITTDKFSNMYFYLQRMGLRTTVYWIFQYLYWMALGSLTILVTFVFSKIIGQDFDNSVGYFLSAWFHVSLGVFLGTIFRNKKFINIATTVLLVIGFIAPIVLMFALPQSQSIEERLRILRMVPIYFPSVSPDVDGVTVGIITSSILMLLSSYLAPLLCVSEGMYVGSKRNFLYFLSPRFWSEGIVALPSHSLEEVAFEDRFHDEAPTDEEKAYDLNVSTFSGPTIQFQQCVKTFGDKVIGPMNVSLSKGKITTLLGGNGVGKSTMIKISSGYYIPQGGEIVLEGKNLFREDTWELLRSISFCPQDNILNDYLTVDEHLQLVTSIRDMSAVDDIEHHLDFILETLGILSKRTTLAKNLSGGMKRRLCLAMAVTGWPKVILADEPSSGVDSSNQRGIWKLLETAKQYSAIMVTSHSAIEAAILSESVVTMTSSVDIVQTTGKEAVTFAIKDKSDNNTTEYEVSMSEDLLSSIPSVIESLPNDGGEWKFSSKSLTTLSTLPGFHQVLADREKTNEVDSDTGDNVGTTALSQPDSIPTMNMIESPSTMKQIYILLSVTFFHPDRIGFLMIMGIPLNVGFIIFTHFWGGFSEDTLRFLVPLVPLIFFIGMSILVSNSTQILAAEKELKVAKLLFSQGITRLAYLSSYLLYYLVLSFPVAATTLCIVGSKYGGASNAFALFVLLLSFWFMHIGLCLMLAAILNARTAMITTILLPSIMGLFGQGALSATFADKYPGSNGQVMTGLLIDVMSNKDWTWFGVSIIINLFIGAVSLTIFLLKFENYNPSQLSLCSKNEDLMRDGEEESNTFISEGAFLEGRNLIKIYGTGVKDSSSFRALNDVSFAVQNGSLLGLVGRSGAGKTTLMEILSGQVGATSGNLYVEGEKVKPSNIATVVSLCSQLDTIWPDMKVINAIKIFMKCRGYSKESFSKGAINDDYVKHLISELGMEDLLTKEVKKLSGGQKRRLAFLSSLVGSTKVVLIDEAMTGVDVETRQIMWKILQDEVNLRSRSVVVTTHDVTEVETYCNTVGILHDGKLVEMGLLKEIKKKWSDNMKLLCFMTSDHTNAIREAITRRNPQISVGSSPDIEKLSQDDSKTLTTFSIDLGDIRNLPSLIKTMGGLEEESMLYWSLQQFNLDDFVRSTGDSDKKLA